jgi:hypothetical protein
MVGQAPGGASPVRNASGAAQVRAATTRRSERHAPEAVSFHDEGILVPAAERLVGPNHEVVRRRQVTKGPQWKARSRREIDRRLGSAWDRGTAAAIGPCPLPAVGLGSRGGCTCPAHQLGARPGRAPALGVGARARTLRTGRCAPRENAGAG